MDAMGRFSRFATPYQLREALDCGGFDAALDVEIVLRHVYFGVTGEGLYCLHRHTLRLKLAHESVAARVRRERPDAGDRCNRGGELVAEVRRVARLIPALARPHDKATGIKYSIEAARFLLPRRFNAILGK